MRGERRDSRGGTEESDYLRDQSLLGHQELCGVVWPVQVPAVVVRVHP